MDEDGGRRVENGELRLDKGELRYIGECGNEDLELKIEGAGLLIEDWQSRFEDFILPHQHLMHIFLFIHCHKSRNFEYIVKLNFLLEDALQLFPGVP